MQHAPIATTHQPEIKYRRDVDGLRAVAIGSVLLFHAFPTLLPGGFVGVDVFFVISGYLISSIILSELSAGRFSLLRFYARRACRIFPALIVVLLACLAAGWILLLPDEYAALGKHVAAGAFYVSNFVLRGEAGYFDMAAETKPLLHLWSLAIEEQFYLVWPLAAMLAYRHGKRRVLQLLAAALLASFVYNVVRVNQNPVATFYMPGTRVWELLIGALLASAETFGAPGIQQLRRGVVAEMSAALGLALVVCPMIWLSGASPFPGYWAALPTVGTALLVAAGQHAAINRVLLASAPMVGIGLISYPLYLWHWPLLSMATIAGAASSPVRVGLVAAAVLLAYLTYRFVEAPIRFGTMPRIRAAVGLTVVCSAVGLMGLAAYEQIVQPYAARIGVERIVQAAGEWQYPDDLRPIAPASGSGQPLLRKAGTGGAKGVSTLFVGDSNIEQYYPRVRALVDANPAAYREVLFLTGGGCPPISVVTSSKHPHCDGLVDAAIAAASSHEVSTVVLGAQWWGYFSSAQYRVGEKPMHTAEARQAALHSLAATIKRLRADGRRVFVLLNIPIGAELNPRNQVDRGIPPRVVPKSVPMSRLQQQFGTITRELAAAAREAGATVIDPVPYLCSETVCPALSSNGDPMYKDNAHLRPAYVREHVGYLDQTLAKP